MPTRTRCDWCGTDPLYVSYHDEEWAVPVRDDRKLFEFLILEGAQAGLSWITILRKREHYRKVFADFDPVQVAEIQPSQVEELLADPGIVRNRMKVESAITNAKAFLTIQAESGCFADYIWKFAGGEPLTNRFLNKSEVPTKTGQSDAMSRDLRQRGFKFVGSTICYAYMQATGMVNDHLTSCFRHAEV
ncbi:MAG: DNA-3-methyladenine glycosylase I [Planctomycetota bacterium]|nr:DNA-3-methyladenine glycosylase I [Planctomycetota bacterium]